ncbi:hypothetical protein BXZ70DRAFT_905142 [Cristinia sonorae]|uniref:Uncharacterized protein n=1 Tax=Cristinia sonorae TaxID=1940300 RepID=A0A8K0UVA4_9AGAR|nr:hypothetical protein BXZ70DRAFT_905142 [Cristinia sonorae]
MQQPTSSSRPARLPLIFSGIAAFACICIVVIFRGPSSPSYTWVGDDFPHTLPISLPPKKHVMKADESHFGLQADHEWSAIFPKPWNGFLSLGPEKRTFAVSVYHQLHCLDLIRGALNDKINEEFTEFVGHAEHCLRYLKDTILCRADMTLEKSFWSEDRHGNTVPGADGVGATHECVDWDVLKTFMEENPVVLPPNATAKGGETSPEPAYLTVLVLYH